MLGRISRGGDMRLFRTRYSIQWGWGSLTYALVHPFGFERWYRHGVLWGWYIRFGPVVFSWFDRDETTVGERGVW